MISRSIRINSDFPGGNILVESISGDVVRLRQDRRTTKEWWFYWAFLAQNVAGRTVRFEFTDGNVFGACGPCFSQDGNAWQWLGSEVVRSGADGAVSFTCTFPTYCDEAHLSFCIPYTEKNLQRFLAEHPGVKTATLTTSEKGRSVERLLLESESRRYLVPVTVRTHACETMGSYVLEGMMAFWLNDTGKAGRFLRRDVDLQIIPFFDKDGVEEGDQGKLRRPHDHNRDFSDSPLYASTQAFVSQIQEWPGHMALALDLHCPYIRGQRDEELFLVGAAPPWKTEQERFSALLESSQQGSLTYQAKNDIPYGETWNNNIPTSCGDYLRSRYPVAFACAVETPYALASGQIVTEAGAHAFGQDLARATALFLQDWERRQPEAILVGAPSSASGVR